MRLFQLILGVILITQPVVGQRCLSPNKQLNIAFSVNEKGVPTYQIQYNQKPVILESSMGFELFQDDDLMEDFKVLDVIYDTKDEVWSPVWGDSKRCPKKIQFCMVLPIEIGKRISLSFFSQEAFGGHKYAAKKTQPDQFETKN